MCVRHWTRKTKVWAIAAVVNLSIDVTLGREHKREEAGSERGSSGARVRCDATVACIARPTQVLCSMFEVTGNDERVVWGKFAERPGARGDCQGI